MEKELKLLKKIIIYSWNFFIENLINFAYTLIYWITVWQGGS